MASNKAIGLSVAAALVVGAVVTGKLFAQASAPTAGVAQAAAPPAAVAVIATVPGMPPVPDARNLYSETAADKFSPVVLNDLPRIYVPNLRSNDVYVVDPALMKVVIAPTVEAEFERMVEQYIDNLIKRFGGEI